jgi:hypothetical protein
MARGSLQYSDLVVKHWPKFAKEDPTKATITIADLLRHDSGLACFGTPAQHQYLTMVRVAPSPPVVALYCVTHELCASGSLSAVHPCLSSPARMSAFAAAPGRDGTLTHGAPCSRGTTGASQ